MRQLEIVRLLDKFNNLRQKQHPDYAEADLSQNSNTLYRIATETHVTAVHGGGAEMRQLEIVRLLDKFNNLRQKQGMSIGKLKKLLICAFTTNWERMENKSQLRFIWMIC